MDAKNGLVNFALFVVLLAFSFVFSIDGLAAANVTYGVLALIGFIVCLAGSLFTGVLSHRDGEALAIWYFTYSVVVGIVLVRYLTRCGTAFGWW